LGLAREGRHANVIGIQGGRAAGDAATHQHGMTIQTTEVERSGLDHDHKRAALSYLHEAWAEARLDGIDGDCLAQVCLFAAFAELVTTYGEEAAAGFAEGLALRIRNGEFSLALARQ
jgi:hypothetical protein